MIEGSVSYLKPPPGRWPPESAAELFCIERPDCIVECTAEPDGAVRVSVSRKDGSGAFGSTTCPVRLSSATYFRLQVDWRDPEIVVLVNGEQLPAASLAGGSPLVLTPPDVADRRDARAACETWIARRRFLSPPAPRDRWRRRTLGEEADALEATAAALEHLAQAVSAGRTHLAPALLRELRAAIAPGGGTLFLAAGRGDTPLPVYALLQPDSAREPPAPSLSRRSTAEALLDFEEWVHEASLPASRLFDASAATISGITPAAALALALELAETTATPPEPESGSIRGARLRWLAALAALVAALCRAVADDLTLHAADGS